MEQILVVIQEMINQFRIWKDQLCRLKMKPELWLSFHRSFMSLVACLDGKHYRFKSGKDLGESFELCWINRQLKQVDFETCVKIVKRRLPNQEKEIARMTELYNKLEPIWSQNIIDLSDIDL